MYTIKYSMAKDAITRLQPAALPNQVNVENDNAMKIVQICVNQTPASLPMDDFANLAKSGAAYCGYSRY